MPQDKAVSDNTLARLHDLKDRLNVCLEDAEGIRTRYTKALEANAAWPDLRSASRPFVDLSSRLLSRLR